MESPGPPQPALKSPPWIHSPSSHPAVMDDPVSKSKAMVTTGDSPFLETLRWEDYD